MDELEGIAETLRRQRKDLEQSIETTSSRSSDAAELVTKIEELRRRSEDTLRRFQSSLPPIPTPKGEE